MNLDFKLRNLNYFVRINAKNILKKAMIINEIIIIKAHKSICSILDLNHMINGYLIALIPFRYKEQLSLSHIFI